MLAIRRSSRILTTLFILPAATSAAADDRGWYLGIGYGDAIANYEVADFDDGSVSNGVIDNSDSAWKVFGGYAFDHHFAVELGYSSSKSSISILTPLTVSMAITGCLSFVGSILSLSASFLSFFLRLT